MKRKDLKQTLSLIVAGVMVTCVANGATGNHVDKIIAELKNSRSDQILVVAHRGDWRNHPENSIKALEGCIEMGVDIVEFDVRRTRDGIFVLMHDSTVDRTSNGSGNIADMTFKEVRKLRLKHKGKVTDQHVPSLEEILDVAKGEIMINIDKAGVSKELINEIRKTGTLKQIIFKSGKSVDSINASLAKCKGAKGIFFMPVLHKGGMDEITEYLEVSIRPQAVELCFDNDQSPFFDEELIRKLRAKGLRPWVNTLWPSLCAGYNDSKAVRNPDETWGVLIEKGYTMIQTDNPEELLQYLRSKGLHKFDGRRPEKKVAISKAKKAA